MAGKAGQGKFHHPAGIGSTSSMIRLSSVPPVLLSQSAVDEHGILTLADDGHLAEKESLCSLAEARAARGAAVWSAVEWV
jgi:hypothetical protein